MNCEQHLNFIQLQVNHIVDQQITFDQILMHMKQAKPGMSKHDLMRILCQVNNSILQLVSTNHNCLCRILCFLYLPPVKAPIIDSVVPKLYSSTFCPAVVEEVDRNNRGSNDLRSGVMQALQQISSPGNHQKLTYEYQSKHYYEKLTLDNTSDKPVVQNESVHKFSGFITPQQSHSSGYQSYAASPLHSNFEHQPRFFGFSSCVPSTSTPQHSTTGQSDNYTKNNATDILPNLDTESDASRKSKFCESSFDHQHPTRQNSHTSSEVNKCDTLDENAPSSQCNNPRVTKSSSYESRSRSSTINHSHVLSRSKTDSNLHAFSDNGRHSNIPYCDHQKDNTELQCENTCSFQEVPQETWKVVRRFIYNRMPYDNGWFEFEKFGLQLQDQHSSQIENCAGNDSFQKKFRKITTWMEKKRISDPKVVEQELNLALKRMNELSSD